MPTKISSLISSSILTFIFVATIVFFLQANLLAPHLRYGFADVDWGYLNEYKRLGDYPLLKISELWQRVGVYVYQSYFIGILENFFPIDGFNFINIHKAIHFFKFLSAVSLFPLILAISGKKLLAALSTIIYAISYSAVGPIYTVVVSGHYLAITVMNLFILYYWFIIKNNKNEMAYLIILLILYILTLFLSPERMYPLIPFLIIVELFILVTKSYSRNNLTSFLKRVAILVCPLVLVLVIRLLGGTSSFGDTVGFTANTKVIFQGITQGNWHLMLIPLISFGSLFLPREYWDGLGLNTEALHSLGQYLDSFIVPFFTFVIITTILSLFISQKPLKFTLLTLTIGFISAVLIFVLASHNLSLDQSLRLDFPTMYLKPAWIGVFVLSLALASLYEWNLTGRKDVRLLSLALGPFFASHLILLTWLPSAYNLIFDSVHRYLVIPAIGSSLFISALIVLIYEKLKNLIPSLSLIVFLILIPIIQLNFYVVKNYFDYELNFAGTDGAEHARMKNKLLLSLGNFSFQEPSLFYFDEWPPDPRNDYFQETTIIAGFDAWVRFKGGSDPINGISPIRIRNPNICPQLIDKCYIKLKDFLAIQKGHKGILYNGVFYKKENFFAFRLINRDISDIKSEVVNAIGLN